MMNARLSLRPTSSPQAFFAGLLLTLALFAAVLSGSDPVLLAPASRSESTPSIRAEEIHYVATVEKPAAATPVAAKVELAVPRRMKDSTRARPAANEIAPSAIVEQPAPAATTVVPQASRLTLPDPSWHNRDPLLPYTRDPSLPRPPLTAAEREAADKAFARMAASRIPTREEQDAAAREASSPGTIPGRRAGEQGGRGGGIGGSIGVPFSVFTRGPTPAERLRDSIVHAENLERLARLRERAQAKRDSVPN